MAERVPEAKLIETEGGLEPEGPGWFVVNARDACWWDRGSLGSYCVFEGRRDNDARFAQYGMNIHVLRAGEAELHVSRRGRAGGLPRVSAASAS